jgi:probable HAF family extracellular repeat protein
MREAARNKVRGRGRIHEKPHLEVLEGRALLATDFTTIDIPLPKAVPTGINNSGWVVGTSDEGSFVFSPADGAHVHLQYGINVTKAQGINAAGSIVGYYADPFKAFNHGFLLSTDGTYSKLDAAFSNYSYEEEWPEGINNAGQIVGYFGTSSGPVAYGFYGFELSADHKSLRAFDVHTVIPDAEAGSTYPMGINNAGQIVGYYFDTAGDEHGFLLSPDLGLLGTIDVQTVIPDAKAGTTSARGINNNGQIVGTYEDTGGGHHGYVLSADLKSYEKIDDPNGIGDTFAFGINDAGSVVGYYGSKHGFVMSRTQPPLPSAQVVTMAGARPMTNKKHQVTQILVTFDGAVSPVDAGNPATYRLATPGKGGSYTAKNAKIIRLKSAMYDPATKTVTLVPKKPFKITKPVQLLIAGLHDSQGRLIDGDHDGQPGGNATAILTKTWTKTAAVSYGPATGPGISGGGVSLVALANHSTRGPNAMDPVLVDALVLPELSHARASGMLPHSKSVPAVMTAAFQVARS